MADFVWTQKQDIGPSARQGHAMAYDGQRQRTVLFGGLSPALTALADTWAWDGGFWTQVADIGPPGRVAAAMGFDTVRGRIVLFGGVGTQEQGDTWEWDGALWRQVADMGPSPRHDAAMAFHAGLGKTVLFGGASGPTAHNDTWAWDGSTWTQVADTGPSERSGHTMASAESGRILLVGGHDRSAVAIAGMWAYDGQAWTQIDDMGPGALTWAALTDTGDGAVLFGGAASGGAQAASRPAMDSTWRFAGAQWTQVQDMGPAARSRAGCAFDVNRGAVVLFGGRADETANDQPTTPIAVLGDTWELPVAVAPPPPPDTGAIPDITLQPTVLGQANGSEIEVTLSVSAGQTLRPPTAVRLVRLPEGTDVGPDLMQLQGGDGPLTAKIVRTGAAGQPAPYALRLEFDGGVVKDAQFTA